MPLIRPCFLFSILLLATPVYAIPPPEIITSVWQSALQIIGMAAVFLTGAVYALRQWLDHYLGRWQKPVLYSLLLISTLTILGILFMPATSKAEAAPITAERLPIEAIIGEEKDTWLRDWKLQTLKEMQQEANLARQQKQLPAVAFNDVGSFTPQALQRLLKKYPDKFYLLDIREGSERSKFRIRHHAEYRYGDLAQDVLPAELPGDRMIVVLCHSGLRGYLGAYFLQRAGVKQVAFLRGGLALWDKQGFPVVGNEDFKAKKRHLLNKAQTIKADAVKVQLDPVGTSAVRLKDLQRLSYETASTHDLENVLSELKKQPYLLVCKTYSGCFHATNMAWLIEQRGGKVLGIYDESGEHARYIQQ